MTIPEDFTQANQDSYDDLIVSIEASVNKLSLLLGVCDDAKFRDKIIAQYEQELEPEFRCYRLKLDKEEPSITKVISQLIAQEPYLQNQGKAVFTITGTEGLSFLPSKGEYDKRSPQEKFFGYLQWTREALREIPYPIVLWMRQQMAGEISQAAPDFWSWRKGVFRFWCHQKAALSSEKVAYVFEEHRDWLKIEEDKDDFLPVEDLQELVTQIEQEKGEKDKSLATLYGRLGDIYYDRAKEGRYQDYQREQALAIEYLTKAIDVQKEHKMESYLATSLNNLANLYRSQGRYEQAEPLYLQAIEIKKIALPDNHPNLATNLNNLANLYSSQGRYEEAEPLYLQAIEIKKIALPENHPNLATNLNNLANLYSSQGRYEEAEPLYLQAIEIKKIALPENHPNLATNLNNLANLYRSQGRYEQAGRLYLQAIEIDKIALPENHPYLATSLNNLAGLYRSQGRYEQAEPLYLQAIEILKIALPENHPELATHLNNLAGLYEFQGRYEDAEPLYLQAIEIVKIALPENHPSLATDLNNLAGLYKSQGRYKEAEPLFLQAIEIDKIALPDNHPELATDLNNLAGLYRTQGRYEEAEPLLLQAIEILKIALPDNHPNTQTVWSNFVYFIKQVVTEGREQELSDHPAVQKAISHIKSSSKANFIDRVSQSFKDLISNVKSRLS